MMPNITKTKEQDDRVIDEMNQTEKRLQKGKDILAKI